MDIAQAAQLLGMAEEEVVAVADSAAGPVIRTFDGQTYVVVASDRPDGERSEKYPRGKTGVMFMVPPVPNYQGGFPVFVKGTATSDQALADLRDQVEETLGVADELPDVEPVDAAGPDANLNEPEIVETAEALVDDPGPDAPDHLVASGPNPDTGAENLADPSDPTDAGVVVPEGGAHAVLDWVGTDSARARQALDFERSKPSPRSTLVARLEVLADEPSRVTEGR